MKVIRKAGLKPKIQLRLKREVDVHSSLDHPNIVGIVETFETADKVFIALEHMRGGGRRRMVSLFFWTGLQRERSPPGVCCPAIIQ